MKKFFVFLLLPVFSLAQTGKDFKLKGQLNLTKPADWVYLRYSSGDQYITDSTQVKNGVFNFEGKIPEPTVAALIVKYAKQQGEEKAQREVIQFFIEPSKMEFAAKDSLKAYSLSGSKGEKDFEALMKKEESYDFSPTHKISARKPEVAISDRTRMVWRDVSCAGERARPKPLFRTRRGF